MRTETRKEYHDREVKAAFKHLKENRTAPISERKENKTTLLTEEPELIADRINWLLIGSYGYGEMVLAQSIIRNTGPRANKPAMLFQMIGNLEWQCSEDDVISVWKQWDKKKQEKLNQLILKEIEWFKNSDYWEIDKEAN